MPIIMLKLIALILKCVKRFIFNFPSCSTASHNFKNVVISYFNVGDPSEVYVAFAWPTLAVFQEIHDYVVTFFVELEAVHVAKYVCPFCLMNYDLLDPAACQGILLK